MPIMADLLRAGCCCADCPACKGGTPESFTVTITGVAYCDDCFKAYVWTGAGYNYRWAQWTTVPTWTGGVYVAHWVGTGPNDCQWQAIIDGEGEFGEIDWFADEQHCIDDDPAESNYEYGGGVLEVLFSKTGPPYLRGVQFYGNAGIFNYGDSQAGQFICDADGWGGNNDYVIADCVDDSWICAWGGTVSVDAN